MSVEVDLSLPTGSEFCAVSRRNDSLRSRARWTVFAGVSRHRGESLLFGDELPAPERAAIARDLRWVLVASNAR